MMRRICNSVAPWIVGLVVIAATPLFAPVFAQGGCPAKPNWTGPDPQCLGESGNGTYGGAWCSTNTAFTWISFPDDDCNRNVSDTNGCIESFEWTMSCPQGCTYTIQYHYDMASQIEVAVNPDDCFDCDWCKAEGNNEVKDACTGQGAPHHYLVESSCLQAGGTSAVTLQTPAHTKFCQPNGTKFTCTASASAFGQVISEEYAASNSTYGDPIMRRTQETLCPGGGG